MKLLKPILNYFDIKNCHENYHKKLEELRNTKSKIKVLFLIRENQKWSYQSVYEEMANDDGFEPMVVVSLLWLSHIGKDKTRNNLEENYEFFASRGINVDYAYKNGEYVDLKEFEPDIVFYDQPWDLPEIHKPKEVSKFALTCYSPYGMEILENKDDYTQDFHKLLFKFFTGDEYNLKRYESYKSGNSKNCVVTGYPKLDDYLKPATKNYWKDDSKFKIIYAPHHSFDSKGLRFATFQENGKAILELAKNHPETTWIFKPHPRFKYALLRNKIMTEAEIDEYYNEWEEIGSVYTQGDYFDIFKTSDLMITDSCSFMGEYYLLNKPLIRLVTKSKCDFNKLGQEIVGNYYNVKNANELSALLNDIISNNQSVKTRDNELLINQGSSAIRVLENLKASVMERSGTDD